VLNIIKRKSDTIGKIKRQRGFSLVEIIVVIAIIAIFALAAIAVYSQHQKNARDAVTLTYAGQICRAVNTFNAVVQDGRKIKTVEALRQHQDLRTTVALDGVNIDLAFNSLTAEEWNDAVDRIAFSTRTGYFHIRGESDEAP
jgi:prepilin-type N-terminal cleavage/methylation domain-containing protein